MLRGMLGELCGLAELQPQKIGEVITIHGCNIPVRGFEPCRCVAGEVRVPNASRKDNENTFNTHQVMGNGIFKEGTVRPLLFGLQRLRGKSRRGTRFDITGATRGESTPSGVPSNPTTSSPDHLTRTLDEASHLPQSLRCSNNAV